MTHRIYAMSFAKVYPHYVAKAEKKGRTKAEVDEIIGWLTGYSREGLSEALGDERDFERFFAEAPAMNPARAEIKGVVCGVRVEEVEEPLMREIRYLDKLIDELAKGKKMEKVLKHRAQRRRREASPEQREEMRKPGRRVGKAEPDRRHEFSS
jgi:hypothetical protein